MPETTLFKEGILTFGQKDKTDEVEFEFELKEGVTPDQIEFWWPECYQCTQVEFTGTEDKVKGKILLDQLQYQDGNNTVHKRIYFKVKNGAPYYEPHPKTKMRMGGKGLVIDQLQIIGSVHIKT